MLHTHNCLGCDKEIVCSCDNPKQDVLCFFCNEAADRIEEINPSENLQSGSKVVSIADQSHRPRHP